jgi:5-methyltetrahydrofolate--homocysteine methyltransferase
MALGHSTLATGTVQGSEVRVTGYQFARDADELDRQFLEQIEATGLGRIRCLTRGEVLHWQGDPVEQVFVVRSGSLKEYTLLPDGRAYAHRVLGAGGLAGATAYLLGHDHDTITQALDGAQVIALQPSEFDRLLTTNPRFSSLLMKKLAQSAQSSADRARDLGFLDVQQRLKRSLMDLARRHGIATERGLEIATDLTHEDIAQLVAANRSTITVLLNELKKQGLVWKKGRHWVVITPEHAQVLDGLREAVLSARDWEARGWAERAADDDVDPMLALDALSSGMRQVEQLYVSRELELADVMWSASVMKESLALIEACIIASGQQIPSLGTVVFGTVQGDIHDLGKNIVSMFLTARGFRVIDLGVDVPTKGFVAAVREHQPDILAMSALLTTTAENQRLVIRALEVAGLRSTVKVIVGGAPITPHLANEMGADGYAPDAREAVEMAWRLMQS